MNKAKKKQSPQVASCKADDTQTENDECTQPENSDGGDTEDVRSSDESQSCSSASSPSTSMLPSSEDDESNKGIFGLYLLFARLETESSFLGK